MGSNVEAQAKRMLAVFGELVRRYQFRDRNQTDAHGVSVSQCYALEALNHKGPLTMGQLAAHLHLELSTITRMVEQMVKKGLAERILDSEDRRYVRAAITQQGKVLVLKVHSELIAEYRGVLEKVPAQSRPDVIAALEHLLTAFRERGRRTESRSSPRR